MQPEAPESGRIDRDLCGYRDSISGSRALPCSADRAQSPGPPETRELVIGTKVAPPFAMKAQDGIWHGISIDLWRHVAEQIHLRYRFQETTLKNLVDGVSNGSLDGAVAALTVTGLRRREVDFTQPYYSTGSQRVRPPPHPASPPETAGRTFSATRCTAGLGHGRRHFNAPKDA